jgi:putative ABC transport system substrate-binding protein
MFRYQLFYQRNLTMLRIFLRTVLFVCSWLPPQISCSEESRYSCTIGILMPIEHQALNAIVAGFKKSLAEHYPHPCKMNMQNAQGDIKLQRSIIEQFVGQKYDVIVPLGTTATQMTASIVKKQPIVSLAAEYPEGARQKPHPQNLINILDTVAPRKKLDLIKTLLPEIKKITVIYHSGNERNFPELATLVVEGPKIGIAIQKISIQNLTELQTASRHIASDAGALLILKDHLVASGIRLLVPIAEKRALPLITSDEGTVYEGGAIALGVREEAIGELGGKVASDILQGKPLNSVPRKSIEDLTLFYNPKTCEQLKIDVSKLPLYAKQHKLKWVATDYREQGGQK